MSNLLKQFRPSEIVFNEAHSATTTEYVQENSMWMTNKYIQFGTSTSISRPEDKLNEEILFQINKLFTFLQLPENWDSYGAARPSKRAVENAIDFIIRLSHRQQIPFFIVPSPDGDILVEFKKENVTLEFLFGEDGMNEIIGFVKDQELFSKEFNETNEYCSLKWLYSPNGNNFDWG